MIDAHGPEITLAEFGRDRFLQLAQAASEAERARRISLGLQVVDAELRHRFWPPKNPTPPAPPEAPSEPTEQPLQW